MGGDWVKKQTPSGKTYYYNTKTGDAALPEGVEEEDGDDFTARGGDDDESFERPAGPQDTDDADGSYEDSQNESRFTDGADSAGGAAAEASPAQLAAAEALFRRLLQHIASCGYDAVLAEPLRPRPATCADSFDADEAFFERACLSQSGEQRTLLERLQLSAALAATLPLSARQLTAQGAFGTTTYDGWIANAMRLRARLLLEVVRSLQDADGAPLNQPELFKAGAAAVVCGFEQRAALIDTQVGARTEPSDRTEQRRLLTVGFAGCACGVAVRVCVLA
jgi:hypothetical protein